MISEARMITIVVRPSSPWGGWVWNALREGRIVDGGVSESQCAAMRGALGFARTAGAEDVRFRASGSGMIATI